MINIVNFFVYFIYAMRARHSIKLLKIFFCVVYIIINPDYLRSAWLYYMAWFPQIDLLTDNEPNHHGDPGECLHDLHHSADVVWWWWLPGQELSERGSGDIETDRSCKWQLLILMCIAINPVYELFTSLSCQKPLLYCGLIFLANRVTLFMLLEGKYYTVYPPCI